MASNDTLLTGLRSAADRAAVEWTEGALTRVATASTTELLTAYTSAGRRLAGLFPASAGFERWTLADAARALLLLTRAAAVPSDDFVRDALECYAQGDTAEQVSWVRSAAHLPEPTRFLPTMIDTCRTNIVPLFEAVACENPFPSRYFPDGSFNQLAMKAMFNGIRLSRIVGFATRRNANLARMTADFAAERRAAGRPLPIDIDQALAGAAQGTPQGTLS